MIGSPNPLVVETCGFILKESAQIKRFMFYLRRLFCFLLIGLRTIRRREITGRKGQDESQRTVGHFAGDCGGEG